MFAAILLFPRGTVVWRIPFLRLSIGNRALARNASGLSQIDNALTVREIARCNNHQFARQLSGPLPVLAGT